MTREPLPLALMRRLAERGGRSGWISTPQGDLRYTVRGPAGAPPILVLHGLSDSIAGWARAAGQLSAHNELHLLDLPGHGLSADPPDWRLSTMVDAAAAYAKRLDRPHLVGHSLGGWIALRLALRHPELPRALTLINPAGALVPAEELQAFLQLLQPQGAREAWRYLDRAFHRAPIALRLLPGVIVEAMNAPNARGFLSSIGDGDMVLGAELESLQMPVRILWGRHDRFLPEATLPYFRRHLPRAEVQLLERCGHCPHLEDPRALARAIAGEKA